MSGLPVKPLTCMLVVHTDAVNINVSINWRKTASDGVLASDAGV